MVRRSAGFPAERFALAAIAIRVHLGQPEAALPGLYRRAHHTERKGPERGFRGPSRRLSPRYQYFRTLHRLLVLPHRYDLVRRRIVHGPNSRPPPVSVDGTYLTFAPDTNSPVSCPGPPTPPRRRRRSCCDPKPGPRAPGPSPGFRPGRLAEGQAECGRFRSAWIASSTVIICRSGCSVASIW